MVKLLVSITPLLVACQTAAGLNIGSWFKGSSTQEDTKVISFHNKGGASYNPRILEAQGEFTPLSCNTGSWTCTPWPFGLSAGAVEVPCNTCYTMSAFTSGEQIVLTGPLDIKGKLEFPDGTKVSMKTTGVFVQGELSMTSTKIVDGTPDIKIQLTGSSDVFFTPDEQNASVCPSGSCNVGPKPFIVAGGKLDISGLKDICPTWTKINSATTSSVPAPLSYPKQPTLPIPSQGTCTETLISENFETGRNKWYGNLGSQEEIRTHDDGTNYLHISSRTHLYQGPMVEFPLHLRECFITNTDYLFSARIRLLPPVGSNSLCHTSKTNCPKLQFSNMDSSGIVRWRELIVSDGGTINFSDGEWITVRSIIKVDAPAVLADPSDVFSLLTINGVEPGVDISIDDVSISLPPTSSYPDPSNICGDLFINGDAEQLGFQTFPFRSYISSNILTVQEENGNKYFSISNRSKAFDSISYDLNPGCFEKGAVYSFSAKIRLHSSSPDTPRIRLISRLPGQDQVVSDNIQNSCPQVSNDIGWTTCTGDFTAPAHLSTATSVKLLILFPLNTVDSADFDDLSFTYSSSSQSGIELVDGTNIPNCYSTGAEILIPSDDLDYQTSQVRVIDSVSTDGLVQLAGEDLTRVSTVADNADFAAEFAFLSRNIVFENADDDNVGPSLVILNTPNVYQKLVGVDFDGFGQESILGRHPIHFKSSMNSSNSYVGKNTIRNSHNRCINIHSTNNVVVSHNVAYLTKGHCFALQNGDEVGNTFSNNLGAVTLAANPAAGESDNECATYYITNPSNYFQSNVAAGSEKNGFWFELSASTSNNNISEFSDNTSHSNSLFGIKTFPLGLTPSTINTWLNTKVYRNLNHGIIFHNSRNIALQGGVVADNRIGIDVWTSDGINISGIKVTGLSTAFKGISEAVSGTLKHCTSVTSYPLIGVRLHPNAYESDSNGTKVTNVSFEGYSTSTGCNPSSSAFSFNAASLNPASYTTRVVLESLSFDETSIPRDEISLCAAQVAGVHDIFIQDDGSLNPSGVLTGYIVSNHPSMTSTGSCTVLDGTCAQYCVGPDITLFGAESTQTSTSEIINVTPTKAPVKVPVAQPYSGICLTNGDFESGTTKWFAIQSTLSTASGMEGSVNAVKASSRNHQARGGIFQPIATSCLTVDQWYEVRAYVMLSNAGSTSGFVCDPTVMFYTPVSCAGIGLIVNGYLSEVAYTVGPTIDGGWNEVYGVFKATSDIMLQTSINLVVARAPTTADITVDNVSINPAGPNSIGVTNCASPISNGDAETGDHRGWWIRGTGGQGTIEMGSGYSSNYSFKHVGHRTDQYYSMVQMMDISCFPVGSIWKISAKYRVFDESGIFKSCDLAQRGTADACPTFSFRAGNIESTGPLVNENVNAIIVGGWNTIENTFTVTASMAAYEDMWVNVVVPPSTNYELDDIVMTPMS